MTTMTFTTARDILVEYYVENEGFNENALLDILEYAAEDEGLVGEVLMAYRVVVREMRKLFF